MSRKDKTEDVLRDVLARLYAEQDKPSLHDLFGDRSYLVAQDGQYLGMITDNDYDTKSLRNEYGPYGSPYSPTSIFNPYSQYGSEYAQFSVNNPYSTTPPTLMIRGAPVAHVTKNEFVTPKISTDVFLDLLKNDIRALATGQVNETKKQVLQRKGESFIQSAGGVFLGNLKPNKYDSDSIFNKYGNYGSKYSQLSIFNPYGPFGSRYEEGSPFNKYTIAPPKVFVNGEEFAYLTVNRLLKPRLDPETILEWAEQNVNKY